MRNSIFIPPHQDWIISFIQLKNQMRSIDYVVIFQDLTNVDVLAKIRSQRRRNYAHKRTRCFFKFTFLLRWFFQRTIYILCFFKRTFLIFWLNGCLEFFVFYSNGRILFLFLRADVSYSSFLRVNVERRKVSSFRCFTWAH